MAPNWGRRPEPNLYSDIHLFTGHAYPIASAVAIGKTFLATVSDREPHIMVWDHRLGKHVCTLEGHRSRICLLSPVGEDELMSISDDGTTRLWNLRKKKCLSVFSNTGNSMDRENPRGELNVQNMSFLEYFPETATLFTVDLSSRLTSFILLVDGPGGRRWAEGFSTTVESPVRSSVSVGPLVATAHADSMVHIWDPSKLNVLLTLSIRSMRSGSGSHGGSKLGGRRGSKAAPTTSTAVTDPSSDEDAVEGRLCLSALSATHLMITDGDHLYMRDVRSEKLNAVSPATICPLPQQVDLSLVLQAVSVKSGTQLVTVSRDEIKLWKYSFATKPDSHPVSIASFSGHCGYHVGVTKCGDDAFATYGSDGLTILWRDRKVAQNERNRSLRQQLFRPPPPLNPAESDDEEDDDESISDSSDDYNLY